MDTETVDETAIPGDEAVIEEELLIEEISIDGMCGVY
jgi:mycofactocin precursor